MTDETPLSVPDILAFLTAAPLNAEQVDAGGNLFFFAPPPAGKPADHRLPFATLQISDEYDQASNLSRPGVFRLNIGVRRATFQALFASGDAAPHDFTALDTLLPHPVYAASSWLCILNPSRATFERLKPLLAEAYEQAAGRLARRQPKRS
ncbi:hypothetical protein GCM10008957_48270 [Deinococcus ruber]|uniref:DUF6194 domain-containing protein n=1 Tax=Deinococcus ruber TaxID=1848197 RepID=A0A918FF18_9DEIO|nr:hypothetical protein GCM10008957_48270 [Deinococcus ruber]